MAHSVEAYIRQMKGADLAGFLQDRGATLNCPECGKDDMLVQADGPDSPLYVFKLVVDHPTHQQGGTVSLVAMFCMNCGSCRTYAAQRVAEWKREKEAAGE